MNVIKNQFPSIEQVAGQYLGQNTNKPKSVNENGQSFSDIFKTKQLEAESPVRFSKHAANRLSDRHIELSQGQLGRLNAGTQKAFEKGINESLVLVDELAFIVNTRNNTVITAMDQNSSDENVFTNIDGAVIA